MSDIAVSDPDAVQEFCGRWAAAWNGHDGDAVARLCAEDLVYDEPAQGDTVHGRQPIRDFVVGMNGAFPDYHFSLEGLYADVHRRAVLVAWKFIGTYAKTGRRVEFHGDDRLELREDGLIATYRCLYDNALVLKQMSEGQ